jgi:1,4-dihydroxy-2-naphthoate octaprenyltransferase
MNRPERAAAAHDRRPSRWRAWLLAARIPTLPVAATAVLVGTGAAAHLGQFRPWAALGALIVALAIQVGTNLSNDAHDFVRGADTPRRRGPVRATAAGLLTLKQVTLGAYACFGVAALIGIVFALRLGWPVLLIGALAVAAGFGYTGGPWPLGYHGLGEVFVFVFFGAVAVVGTTYVQTSALSAVAAGASVPVGLLATAVLVVNNLRDIETDRAAGKRTLAVRIGPQATKALYVGCLLGAGAAPAVLRALGWLGSWFWLPWLTVPLAVGLIRTVLGPGRPDELNRALRKTAQLQLWFGVLLTAALA